MIRYFAGVWAKVQYVFSLEAEARRNEINGAIASRNATEKRKLVAQLTAEADSIDKSIEEQAKALEAGVWECENGHQEPLSTAFAGVELEISRTCSTCQKPMKMTRLNLMTGQEKYELEKQKKDAQTIADEKRALAKQETENADNGDRTVAVLSGRAQDSRNFADKIRAL